jgi:hypothetical protein
MPNAQLQVLLYVCFIEAILCGWFVHPMFCVFACTIVLSNMLMLVQSSMCLLLSYTFGLQHVI